MPTPANRSQSDSAPTPAPAEASQSQEDRDREDILPVKLFLDGVELGAAAVYAAISVGQSVTDRLRPARAAAHHEAAAAHNTAANNLTTDITELYPKLEQPGIGGAFKAHFSVVRSIRGAAAERTRQRAGAAEETATAERVGRLRAPTSRAAARLALRSIRGRHSSQPSVPQPAISQSRPTPPARGSSRPAPRPATRAR